MLQPGMNVLDLGCGWGTAAAYIHEKSAVNITGVNLAKEHILWASENLAKPGLRFVLQDFRDHCADSRLHGTYDRIYSIGMMEHVGTSNNDILFSCLKNLLKPDGLAVIHTIGELAYSDTDPWFDKYIFPGTTIPSLRYMSASWEPYLILEDFQNFGYDYSLTLDEWAKNYETFMRTNENPKYTDRFHRMMMFYLRLCEGLFKHRINQLYQFVFTPRGTARIGVQRAT